MRILAILLAILLATACSAPCPLMCQSDLECPEAFYCLNNAACLPDCLRCGAVCVDTFSNCGACGVSCAPGQKCALGHCASACNPGTTDCNGSCYNLTNDSFHCGSCIAPCARDEVCKPAADGGGVCTKVDTCQ